VGHFVALEDAPVTLVTRDERGRRGKKRKEDEEKEEIASFRVAGGAALMA
jgi:hypothetical protein